MPVLSQELVATLNTFLSIKWCGFVCVCVGCWFFFCFFVSFFSFGGGCIFGFLRVLVWFVLVEKNFSYTRIIMMT